MVVLPDGESHKDWPNLNRIFDHLLAHACDRKTVLYALGGGVVGDMAGFAAACYMRGVPYVQVPTTLLAQVDSSVGGKTAINHPGRQEHDRRVLPAAAGGGRSRHAGYAAAARDRCRAGRGDQVRADRRRCLLRLDRGQPRRRCSGATGRPGPCRSAARARSRPGWSGRTNAKPGLRAILNFGHTFGHAIEAGLGFGAWLHGEAVGCGMVMAAELSRRCGHIDAAYSKRIAELVARAGLPVRAPALGASPVHRPDAGRQEGRRG